MLRSCKLLKGGFSSSSHDEYNNTTEARDRISELSDDLLSSILEHLTLRDAVRTSVLSHRWRHVWCILTNLEFHSENMFQLHRPCSWADNMAKFVRGVNQFLESYKGTHINDLSVFYRLESDFADDIDRWVNFGIRMGAKNLYLNFLCNKDKELLPKTKAKYVLRTEVFDGVKNNLKKLFLVRCNLGPNFATQFSGLETLVLVCSHLKHYELQSMFSCLVNLKYLKFHGCTLPKELHLGSLHLLKFFFVLNCDGVNYIELSNINLIRLWCDSSVLIKLKNVLPELKFYSRQVTGRQLHFIFSYLPRHLPSLMALYLSTNDSWTAHIPERLTIFSSVTFVKLHFHRPTNFDILKMVSILEVFPSLRKLDLLMSCPGDVEKSMLMPRKHVHRHLEDVKIGRFYGTSRPIEFASYLLKHAIVLKQLIINLGGEQALDESVRQGLYEELRKLSKNSKRMELGNRKREIECREEKKENPQGLDRPLKLQIAAIIGWLCLLGCCSKPSKRNK